MTFPLSRTFKVSHIYDNNDVTITFNSGLTILVGANASGKTQTLRAVQSSMGDIVGEDKVRYISSNRIGEIEKYKPNASVDGYTTDSAVWGASRGKGKRQTYSTAVGDFYALEDRKDIYIKVSERLGTLFNKDIYIEWDSGNLKVFFQNKQSEISESYNSIYEASGLINLVSLLAALYDDEIKVLLIDEPEVSLHPQLQAFLLQEIKSISGDYENDKGKKMVIISTHSPEMIELDSVSDINNIIFFAPNHSPIQIIPEAEELKNEKLKEFILKLGHSYKLAFFAKRVLLVEGISDYMICKFLNRKFNFNLEVAGTQLIPVDGKGNFPTVVKFFRLIGKEVVIITDMDSFIDNNDVCNLFMNEVLASELAISAGVNSLQTILRNVKDRIEEIYLNNYDKDGAFYEVHPYYVNKKEDENIARRRAFISSLFINDSLDDLKALKSQIENVFIYFSKLGCFFLKKGALESYYKNANNNAYDGKPSEAVKEIEYLKKMENECISEWYKEIVDALDFASKRKVINESRAIREDLLTELPAIIAAVNEMSDVEKDDILQKDNLIVVAKNIIKRNKRTEKILFDYKLKKNDKKEYIVQVCLLTPIINNDAFPLDIMLSENINQFINDNVK
ncbi:MAG: AAA family ATPase [Eubacteriales bacterium]